MKSETVWGIARGLGCTKSENHPFPAMFLICRWNMIGTIAALSGWSTHWLSGELQC